MVAAIERAASAAKAEDSVADWKRTSLTLEAAFEAAAKAGDSVVDWKRTRL